MHKEYNAPKKRKKKKRAAPAAGRLCSYLSVSLLSFQPQHWKRAVRFSTILQKHCEMCFNFLTTCVIPGRMFNYFKFIFAEVLVHATDAVFFKCIM